MTSLNIKVSSNMLLLPIHVMEAMQMVSSRIYDYLTQVFPGLLETLTSCREEIESWGGIFEEFFYVLEWAPTMDDMHIVNPPSKWLSYFKNISMKGCRLLDYKVEALSRKKNCISAVQKCKQASVRNTI